LEGHDVRAVYTAHSALESLPTFRPDIVLLDIGLPDMNGYQLAQKIRSAGGSALLVAVTGYGRPEDLQRARDSGFDAHLVKPIDLEGLVAVIAEK
jgi:CheY-like chemotaxis protein